PDMFDIVVFDEASQMPTCEAVPSLSRAKSAVIVGDPKQMPPTSFFMSVGGDDEEPETEDLDSVLDDCLALGMPEKHLTWHYRSKHESLIAFSNINYYSSKLCTFPSPDALDSKVKFTYVQGGVYQRGSTKCNKEEADALIEEVVRRLSDPILRRSSIGIVTFSTPQQVYIEKLLTKILADKGLESYAYDGEEPLFIKNLENVQGDERDVILFSVCYGPDAMGKISLNFGPLNQLGGWRRLNVAVSRAREEMIVFSSMRYSMIDLSRTTSKGVAGLKAFLEFAEKGRTSIAAPSDEVIINRSGIGKYVAAELSSYGYECRCDLGVSDFKIDVGVLDPNNKHNFILAILCDGNSEFSVKDKYVMQSNILKRNNWNVIRLYSVNFFNNPKREIKKIKDYLDKLTSSSGGVSGGFKRPYRLAKPNVSQADASALTSGNMDAELIKTIKAVVLAEEPISAKFLVKRVLAMYGIQKYGTRLEGKVNSLVPACSFKSKTLLGTTHYYKNEKVCSFERYRVEDENPVRTAESDYSPFDVISLVKAILMENVSMFRDELILAVAAHFKTRRTEKFAAYISSCIDEGCTMGMFIRSVSDRISLG
ncbi:MAG: AAA domain-containing protein, partial [Candidatus Coproplasma sp.]